MTIPERTSGMLEEAPPTVETVEQKYVFAAAHAAQILEYIDFALLPDQRYGVGTINSIYFDTFDLHHYFEKRNSDLLKAKVRLRWYGDLDALPNDARVNCFLEVKRKIGAKRRKQRSELTLSARDLRAPDESSEVSSMGLLAPSLGYHPSGPLMPALRIRYHRRRYVDAFVGARASMDTEITAPWSNPGMLPARAALPMDRGVLEVKSTMRSLPPTLDGVASLLRKDAFSKYAYCIETLTESRGRRI